MTDQTKDFIKKLSALDLSKDTHEKFRDFCEMAYCGFAKLTAAPEEAEALEERYMQIVSTYRDKDTVRAYPELLAIAWREIAKGGTDFFGTVASEGEFLNADQGQFFTPFHVSRLMAELTLGDPSKIIEEQDFITVSEPTSGAGGMVLAIADVITAKKFDPSLHMLVSTMDISSLCYHMTFLQLAFRGIPAYVERANTLSMERFEGAWTPPTLNFYKHHGRLFPEGKEPLTGTPEMTEQLTLF